MIEPSQGIKEKYQKHGFDPLRIESITEQLRQICYSGYTNILEIGVAGGFLKHCLKLFPQMLHTSIDISKDMSPDYVGSVTRLPFENNQFEVVVCGQVLEHLPFAEFIPALKEIRRVAKHKAIISLPDATRHFGFAVCLAKLGWLRFEWNPKRRRNARKKIVSSCQHFWEIGYKNSLNKDVVRDVKLAGFKIEKQYRLWEHAWHRFFILQVH